MGLLDAFRRGDLAEARRFHAELFPLCRALLGLAPNPIPVKTALALSGTATASCACRSLRSTTGDSGR